LETLFTRKILHFFGYLHIFQCEWELLLTQEQHISNVCQRAKVIFLHFLTTFGDILFLKICEMFPLMQAI
jgi:hypothetical protein